MTEQAVLEAYRSFLDRMTDEMGYVVGEQFGGGLVGRAAKRGVEPVMKRVRSEMGTQGEVVVAYAATLADGEDDVDELERRFLETNPVYRRYDGDREDELREDLLEHFRTVGGDLAPLVTSPRDDFWAALRDEYSRDEAEAIVDRHFSQAETFREYRDGVFSSRTIADKVIGVVEEGETRLRDELHAELERVYES
jgi:hypothetical protein